MVNLMNRGYVMDYCIAFIKREEEEKAYNIYIADALKLISENTAKMVGGSYLQKRYSELFETEEKEETRTADDVINNIKSKLRKLR